jgi:hypothetical protein
MNIKELISLHEQAIQTLKNIEQNNEAIRKNQDRCVMIEKGNEFVGSLKRDFIAEFHSIIDETRRIRQININQYAEIMQRLNASIVNRMMLVDADGISEVVVTETIESNLLK